MNTKKLSRRRSPRTQKTRAVTRPIGQTLTLTKIEAAEAQLKTAVRMYFENQNIVPVFTLANAVREVVGTIGDYLDVETVQKEIAKARGMTVEDFVRPLRKKANFFKHADWDPTDTTDLDEDDVEMVLFFACKDFGRVANGMPIEAQVFEAWAYAAATKRVSDAPFRRQQLLRNTIQAFPGLRGASTRAEQKCIGLKIMEGAVRDKSLEMTIEREVRAKPQKASAEQKRPERPGSTDRGQNRLLPGGSTQNQKARAATRPGGSPSTSPGCRTCCAKP